MGNGTTAAGADASHHTASRQGTKHTTRRAPPSAHRAELDRRGLAYPAVLRPCQPRVQYTVRIAHMTVRLPESRRPPQLYLHGAQHRQRVPVGCFVHH